MAAAFGLAGCAAESDRPASSAPDRTTVSAPELPATAPLPPPEALTAVLYRLADTAVPGTEKIGAIDQATVADADALDSFGRALRDGGYQPVTFEATDLMWSDTDPGNVVATVTAVGPDPDAGTFSVPMEFTADDREGWQLTRETADMLLELGPADPAAPPG